MLNPQELRDRTFEKAVFGGYDMGAVDDFLSEVSEDYSTLYKEVSVLKAKMKILVDKIEEYRGSESAVNKTLLTAQRVSAEIEDEAREKSEEMLADAEAKAAEILRSVQAELSLEEERLIQAKRSSAEFIEKMRIVCTKQLGFLDALGEMKLAPEIPEVPEEEPYEENEYAEFEEFEDSVEDGEWDTVRSIEDSVAKLSDEPEPDAPDTDMDYITDDDYDDAEPTRLFNLDEDTGSRPKFNFENLRFGENYDQDK